MEQRKSYNDFEFCHRYNEGRVQYFRSTGDPVFFEDDDFQRYRGVTANITKEKEAELASKLSEERFRDFTLSAVDRFWETDENHKYVYLSPPTSRFKAMPENLIGKTLWDSLIGRADPDMLEELKSETAKCETFHDLHISWRGLDGDMRHAQFNGIATFDDDGKFSGYRGTTINIIFPVERLNSV